MSNDTTTTPTPFYDEGCRILTISASLAGATAFIERLQALSGSEPASVLPSSVPPPSGSSAPQESGFLIVPYTLANRYYTADVHFAAYAMQALYPSLFALDRRPDYKPPPAVVFVWVEGEPYEKHIEELSRMMAVGGYEPEVSLAVRIPKVPSAASTVTAAATTTKTQTPTPMAAVPSEFEGALTNKSDNDITETDRAITAAEDEDADIDTTLMSFGFEYVDATRESLEAKPARTDTADDIPHLPRVLDALSTIMWPSMHSHSTPAMHSNPKPKATSTSNTAQRHWKYGSIADELLSVSELSSVQSRSTPTTHSNPKSNAIASAAHRHWKYGSIADELLGVSGLSGSTPVTHSNPESNAASAAHRHWKYGSIADELLGVSGISGISGADDSRARVSGAASRQHYHQQNLDLDLDLDSDLDADKDKDKEDADADKEDADTLFSPYDFTSTPNAHIFFGASSSSSSGAAGAGFVVREEEEAREEREDRAWVVADGAGVSTMTTTTMTTTEISTTTTTISTTRDAHADPAAGMVTSPVDVDADAAMAPFGRHDDLEADSGGRGRVEIGFEDDFTVFVSAPAEAPARAWAPLDGVGVGFGFGFGAGFERGGEGSMHTAGGLMPSSGLGSGRGGGRGRGRGRGTMAAYRSLGSVSDFGGDDDDGERSGSGAIGDAGGAGNEDEDEDEDGEEWEDGVDDEVDESWVEYAEVGEWDDEGDGDAEEEEEEADDGEDEDEGMPTKDEIVAAAARIFGGVPRSLGGGGGFRKASEVNRELGGEGMGSTSTSTAQATAEDKDASGAVEGSVGASPSATAGASTSPPSAPARAPPTATDLDDDDDDDDASDGFYMRPFDVERVLHALQDLRSEIAGVADEEERRRMAARVALGFVYGMEVDLGHGGGEGDGGR